MIFEFLKAILLGVVEGITEWLPISSTGHMILVDEFVQLNVPADFLKLFLVVIQLGAIMAVIILYFNKLNPFSKRKTRLERRSTLSLWGKVIVATIPAGIIGVLFDDWANAHLYNYLVVAIALIVYGIAYIALERYHRSRADDALVELGMKGETVSGNREYHPRHTESGVLSAAAVNARLEENRSGSSSTALELSEDSSELYADVTSFDGLGYGKALLIGLFQCLAIVPGTSRSGSTILGGMILGLSRTLSAEFAFFLAIPIMFGWSLVKIVKFGFGFTAFEAGILATGCIVSFLVSILSIKFLMGYIRKNDFTAFGIYRVILGIVVIAFFTLV